MAVQLATQPIRVDGFLGEADWLRADSIDALSMIEPVVNGDPTFRTSCKILATRQNIYLGIRCFDDDPKGIVAFSKARDSELENEDYLKLILDTYGNGRSGYIFAINPYAARYDALVSNNGESENPNWDGAWEARTQVGDMGWTAEIRIPVSTLTYNKSLDYWGFNVERRIQRFLEVNRWSGISLDYTIGQTLYAGQITQLPDFNPGIGLTPRGSLVLKATQDGQEEASYDWKPSLDVSQRITTDITAQLTVNTDFAQTEVDQQEINLTRFSLFYPEKRDFFLDGSNYFDFGINGDRENEWNTRLIPFFSRRIGLDSAGNPIPVLYGGKVTGQAGKWNIGTMYMKDQRPGWEYSHFAVTRIYRNFKGQSQAGLIGTYGNALRNEPNGVLGFDVKLATSEFRGNRNMGLILFGLKSFSGREGNGIRPPGRELAYGAEFVYPNDLIHLRLGHMQIQEEFRAGLGFVPRPGVRQSYGTLLVGPRPNRWGILQVSAGPAFDHITDFNGKLLTRKWTLTPLEIRFRTGEEMSYRIYSNYEYLTASFNIYDETVIPEGTYGFLYHTVSGSTARRRDVWAAAGYRFGGFFDGTRHETELEAGYKVAVPLFIGGEWIRNDVQLPEGSFVAHIYRLNLNILFSPDITLYHFLQYDSQSEKMGWQTRFQWILTPGREVFLVWNSRAADPYERFHIEEAAVRLKVKFTFRF